MTSPIASVSPRYSFTIISPPPFCRIVIIETLHPQFFDQFSHNQIRIEAAFLSAGQAILVAERVPTLFDGHDILKHIEADAADATAGWRCCEDVDWGAPYCDLFMSN